MLQAFRCSDSVVWAQCQHFPEKVQGTLVRFAILGRVETKIHLSVAFKHSLWIAPAEEISAHQ